MPGFWQGAPNESVTQNTMGVSALETTTGQVLGAVAGEALASNPAPRLARALFTPVATPDAAAHWERYRDPARRDPTPDTLEIAGDRSEGVRMLSPEEANQAYGIKGSLTFDRPISEPVARDLSEARKAQLARQDVINRRADGLLTGMVSRGAVGLMMGVLDPLNLAAALIPGVGQETALGLIARASWAERQVIRGAYGASQGAIGTAALEPLIYGLDAREQADWSMGHALQSIAFGGVLGGGLHVLLRAPGGRLTAQMEAAGHEARRAALQAAVAQHLADAPTNIDVALAASALDTTALRSAYRDRLAARGDTTPGGYVAFTPGADGVRVELRPEVVDLQRLIVSHDDTGKVNPAYPHEEGLQPRDRSNAASQAQITELASRLEPERLGPSPEAGAGAPIVNAAGVVESGNGRTMALRRVYSDPRFADQAAAYRAYIEAQGFDTAGMAQPVLIGRRVTDLTPEQMRAFTRGANERATLGLNAAEQARMDATRAGKAVAAYQGGEITARENQPFVAAFMAQIPAEERGAMILAGGRLSAQGEARLRAALLAHAYGDALGPTLERFLNGDTEHIRGVAGALTDLAGAWSHMRAAAAAGDIPAGLDITPAIGEAVQLLDRARTAKLTPGELVAQLDMLEQPSPAALALLRLMHRDDAMRLPVARAKLTDLLDRYVEQAMQAKPGPGLFGEPETTAADILRTVGGDSDKVRAVADALADAADPPPRAEDVLASREAEAKATEVRQSEAGTGAEASLFEPEAARPTSMAGEPSAQAREAAAPGLFDPPAITSMSPELQEAMRLAEEATAAVRAEIDAGRLAPEAAAELAAADHALETAMGNARAYEAAAACLVVGMGAAAP